MYPEPMDQRAGLRAVRRDGELERVVSMACGRFGLANAPSIPLGGELARPKRRFEGSQAVFISPMRRHLAGRRLDAEHCRETLSVFGTANSVGRQNGAWRPF